MAVMNQNTRDISYVQSGAGSYQLYYGSGLIGVTYRQYCQGAH